jgi:hypothetical protein
VPGPPWKRVAYDPGAALGSGQRRQRSKGLAEQLTDRLTAKEHEAVDLYQRGMSQPSIAVYLDLTRWPSAIGSPAPRRSSPAPSSRRNERVIRPSAAPRHCPRRTAPARRRAAGTFSRSRRGQRRRPLYSSLRSRGTRVTDPLGSSGRSARRSGAASVGGALWGRRWSRLRRLGFLVARAWRGQGSGVAGDGRQRPRFRASQR